MQIKTTLIAITLAATTATANPLLNSVQQGGFCGTAAPSEEERQASRSALAQVAASFAPQADAFNVTVPVYIHVVAADKTVQGGYLAVRESIFPSLFRLIKLIILYSVTHSLLR